MKEILIGQSVSDIAALDRCRSAGMFEGIDAEDEDYSRAVVPKPWGFEYQVSLTPEKSVWKLTLTPGGETSMHAHPNKETLLIVTDGEIEFSTLDGSYSFDVGAIVRIARGTFHKSYSRLGAVLIEIEWPPKRNDLIRLDDRYGRKGKGYTK